MKLFLRLVKGKKQSNLRCVRKLPETDDGMRECTGTFPKPTRTWLATFGSRNAVRALGMALPLKAFHTRIQYYTI